MSNDAFPLSANEPAMRIPWSFGTRPFGTESSIDWQAVSGTSKPPRTRKHPCRLLVVALAQDAQGPEIDLAVVDVGRAIRRAALALDANASSSPAPARPTAPRSGCDRLWTLPSPSTRRRLPSAVSTRWAASRATPCRRRAARSRLPSRRAPRTRLARPARRRRSGSGRLAERQAQPERERLVTWRALPRPSPASAPAARARDRPPGAGPSRTRELPGPRFTESSPWRTRACSPARRTFASGSRIASSA